MKRKKLNDKELIIVFYTGPFIFDVVILVDFHFYESSKIFHEFHLRKNCFFFFFFFFLAFLNHLFIQEQAPNWQQYLKEF